MSNVTLQIKTRKAHLSTTGNQLEMGKESIAYVLMGFPVFKKPAYGC